MTLQSLLKSHEMKLVALTKQLFGIAPDALPEVGLADFC